jgi:hypothetical protein
MLGFGLVIAMCLMASSCGAPGLDARGGATVTTAAPTSLTGVVCYPSTVTQGCQIAPAEAAMWAQVWNAPVQAAHLEMVEEQYATCFSYAGLDQDLTNATTPIGEACSSSGLTQTEAQQIRGLIMESA